MTEENISEKEKAGIKFLEQDFGQCFQQMRHYDSQIIDILKFLFAAYSALIGISIGLYQFSLKEKYDLLLPAIFAISVGLLIGIFLFCVIVRNRVYFVIVSRYVNSVRDFFLEDKPLEFRNPSKMYTDYTQPVFFNWRSSQTVLYCVVAVLNSILFGTLLFFLFPYAWVYILIGSSGSFILHVFAAIRYLKSREGKSSLGAILGK